MDGVDPIYQIFIRAIDKTEDSVHAMRMIRYHFNKMEEVYYDYEDGEEVVVPLSESAYIAFDIEDAGSPKLSTTISFSCCFVSFFIFLPSNARSIGLLPISSYAFSKYHCSLSKSYT